MKLAGIFVLLLTLVGCDQSNDKDSGNSEKIDTVIGSTEKNINDAEHVLLQFEVDNKPCFATINQFFKDYKNKQAFPYSLWVTVETSLKNKNGHPTDEEAILFNSLEDSLIKAFAENTPFCYIGRTTRDEYREIMFYISDKQEASEILTAFIKDNKFKRKIQYEISQDNNWKNVSGFYQ